MNSFKQIHKRRVRRLPHVPRKNKFHLFYPTYRGAVNWMRQHKETIDTFIGLMEIYPNLISDYSLDLFWDFVKPFLDRGPNVPTPQNRENVSQPQTQSVVLPKIKPGVPIISVTHDSDPDDDIDIMADTSITDLNKTPKAYIAGKLYTPVKGDTTCAFVENVSSFAYVCHNAEPDKSVEALYEADYLIYLQSEQSLTNLECCRKLLMAWSLDIPTIFVRDKDFKLPSPLPETFLQLAMKCDEIQAFSKNGMRRSLTPSVGKRVFGNGKTGIKRADSATSVFQHGNPISGQTAFNSSNLVLDLINGYRDAIAIDDRFPMSAVQELKACLNKRVDMSRSSSSLTNLENDVCFLPPLAGPGNKSSSTKRVPFLSIPTPIGNSLRIDTVPLTSRLTPVHIRVPSLTEPISNGIDQDPDSGVHSPIEKETLYVVYPDPVTSKNSAPKVVKWPLEAAELLDPNLSPESTVDSPITFNDIDLSAEVNYDLLSPEGSITLE